MQPIELMFNDANNGALEVHVIPEPVSLFLH
jgi:hypothetical protein